MCKSWPLAYVGDGIEEPLPDHLLRTACLTSCLFKGNAEVLLKRWGRKWDSEQILWLLGFLHDIGKISNAYREGCRSGRVSFSLHEYVSSLIVYKSGDILLERDVDLGDQLKVLANAIVRHHSAMIDRDPVSILRSSILGKVASSISKVLGSIEEGVLESILVEGLKEVRHESLLRNSMLQALRELKQLPHTRLGQLMSNFRVKGELWLVSGLTGFLVVADNIVANSARRIGDDGFTPIYISLWIRELKDKLSRCYYCFKVAGFD